MTGRPMLDSAAHAELAARLHLAARDGSGTTPPSEETRFNFADAYRIRRRFVDLMIAAGARPTGHKIGFTSGAMQQMYGMDGPDFGQLMAHMFVPADAPVPVSGLSDTRVEPELAFVMARPLEGPGVTLDDALAATREVRAAIEVIDSRVGAMRAKAVDSIADNAGAGLVVLGDIALPPETDGLDRVPVEITTDGEALAGISGDVMGHPAAPLAWLANRLAEIDGLGGRIEAGDVVLTGSSTRSQPVAPGSHLEASFGPFGKITLDFA